jgi:hypothetical protein
MYASGIPMGIITDRKSPRLAAIIGMFALFAGYYPIKLGTEHQRRWGMKADHGQHTMEARVT